LTSKRLSGRGGDAQEVNCRAVLAAPRLGHAGLTQFCAGMNLPPPVTKKAYNDHQIQIKTIAVGNAEMLMKDAAKRLVDKVMEVLLSQMCRLQLMDHGKKRTFIKNLVLLLLYLWTLVRS
jgi:hypothetical protein